MNRKKIHIPADFFALSVQDAVQAICQNMFDELNFDYFGYRRQYFDGTTIHLMNSGKDGNGGSFLKALYGEGVYFSVDEIEQVITSFDSSSHLFGFVTPKFSLTDGLTNQLIYQKQIEIAHIFNIGKNKTAFFQNSQDFTDMIIFGSSFHETGTFCNFCIQNLSVLQNFVKYFRRQAKSLIEAAKEDPILLAPSLTYKIPKTNLLNFTGYNFKEKRKITLQFTEQEANSLELLASGKTVGGIASDLRISLHAVKNHFHEATKRSDFQTIYELLKIFPTLARR
ncbi:LuxR C-terminal-related transcriptional regulator [Candidatus Finniella inopinata]|uniref:HTH luxR-type domain-containing protein n=1 Tax=Candidatus Finniella inopinata TaxID=1696036 RepID=A0A4Q7DIL4_9PROT|nr:LuxR C-terminal-related transcriptional regulator [Candidatus Finniella inopinata]RZI45945.1 hypothetical protein EQU50_05800 [Candidatus Finniella inopinata]